MNRLYRKSLIPAVALVLVGLVLVPDAVAQRTIYSGQGWNVRAPDRVSCGGLPELEADGGRGSILDSRNQAALTAMLAVAAPILRAQCPNLGEVIVASGNSRRIMALPARGAAPPAPNPSNAGGRPAPAAPVAPPRPGSTARRPVAGIVQPAPVAPRPPIAGSTRRLPGIYDGTITCNQALTGVRVTVDVDVDVDGLVSAEWVNFAPNGNPNRPTTRSSLSGRYDGETGRLRLDRAASGFRNPRWALDAAFDSSGETISGEVLGRDCGPVLLRASQDKSKDTRKMREEAGERFDAWTRGPRAVDDGDNDYERCYAMVRWVARLGEEYPDTRLRFSGPEATHLFMDSDFVPVFGKPYDELSGRQRNGLFRRFRECRREGRIPGSLEWTSEFEGGFSTSGSTFSRLSSQIAFRRQARAQWNVDMQRLSSLPATEQSFDEALRIDAAHLETRKILWPSEVKRLEDAVASSLGRSAESVLVRLVDEILEDATGVEALDGLLDPAQALRSTVTQPVIDESQLRRQAGSPRELRAAVQRIDRQVAETAAQRDSREKLLSLVSSDVRSRELGRMTVRAREIAQREAIVRFDEVKTFGEGLEALERGPRWAAAFQRDLGNRRELRDLRTVQLANEYFLLLRRQALIEARPELIELLHEADSPSEIGRVLSRYVGVDGDRESAAGRQVINLAAGRRELLEWASTTACRSIPDAFVPLGFKDSEVRFTRFEVCVGINGLFEEQNARFRSIKAEGEARRFQGNPSDGDGLSDAVRGDNGNGRLPRGTHSF